MYLIRYIVALSGLASLVQCAPTAFSSNTTDDRSIPFPNPTTFGIPDAAEYKKALDIVSKIDASELPRFLNTIYSIQTHPQEISSRVKSMEKMDDVDEDCYDFCIGLCLLSGPVPHFLSKCDEACIEDQCK